MTEQRKQELQETEYVGPDGLIWCSLCHTPRQRRIHIFNTDQVVFVLCDCLEAKREAEEAAMKQRELETKVRRLRAAGLADPTIRACTFENDQGFNGPELEKIKIYVNQWPEMRRRNLGLLLYGSVGTGKTYLAGCAANALVEQGVPVMMTSLSRILGNLTGVYPDRREEYLRELDRYALLVLDDFGTERATDFAMEQIFNVVDGRVRCGKPMIVTTNLNLSELQKPKDLAHERIYSRILERCAPICVNRMNLRKRNAAETLLEAKALLG